jgi:hypothetical protein
MKTLFLSFLLLCGVLQPVQEKTVLEVKYLHGNKRCDSCSKIEQSVRKTIFRHFQKQFRDGQIVFVIKNFQAEENRELARKYEIWGSALILKSTKNGKESITDISELAHKYANREKVLVKLLKEEFDKKLKE